MQDSECAMREKKGHQTVKTQQNKNEEKKHHTNGKIEQERKRIVDKKKYENGTMC